MVAPWHHGSWRSLRAPALRRRWRSWSFSCRRRARWAWTRSASGLSLRWLRHFGRTMSPAAAVVMMAARLSGAGPRELIRRVAGPLLIGLAVLVVAGLLGIA